MTSLNLGRVQGGSIFVSSVAYAESIAVSTLSPTNIKPLVGDSVLFSNGEIRKIITTTATAVTLGEVVATVKIDGEKGITQIELDGILKQYATLDTPQVFTKSNGFEQPIKLYYNMGESLTSELCGDGIAVYDDIGKRVFVQYPFEDGIFATQKYVQDEINKSLDNGVGGEYISDKEFVTIDTEQTINGAKTFTQPICIGEDEETCIEVCSDKIVVRDDYSSNGETGTKAEFKFPKCDGDYILATQTYVDEAVENASVSVTLNERQTNDARFFAPTRAGNYGEVLVSNGFGEPFWAEADKMILKAYHFVVRSSEDEEEDQRTLLFTLYGYGLEDAWASGVPTFAELCWFYHENVVTPYDTLLQASGIWDDALIYGVKLCEEGIRVYTTGGKMIVYTEGDYDVYYTSQSLGTEYMYDDSEE